MERCDRAMRILVADDDAVYRMLMAHELSKWGYEVELAGDGLRALAALEGRHAPNLAILDWRMPGIDGVEVCRRVRAQSDGQYVYLLLVTARDTPADLLEGLDAGADDYLNKPVDMAELRMRIRAGSRVMEFAERSRQLFERAPIAYHEMNAEGVLVRVNQAECKLLRYAPGELVGRPFWDFVAPAQAARAKASFQIALDAASGPIEDSEWELLGRYGNPLQVRLQQNRILDRGGRVAGLRCTILDVTELRLQQELLNRQAEDLKRSNAELEQFAYVASHDLQEPLRMVASFAQLLARRCAGRLNAEADEYIGFIVNGAKRMQQQISDLLALSRVGTRGGKFEETDLNGVLEEVLQNLGPSMAEQSATVTHQRLPSVVVDRGQMAQLLQNLIGNSIKFHGAEPPRVDVSAARSGQEWTVSVRDNGIGIPSQHAERVFRIFQRLHSSEQYPGTGIGLAVCQKIVERHGGRIWFDSEPGAGTTFRFTLSPRGRRQGEPGSAYYENRVLQQQ